MDKGSLAALRPWPPGEATTESTVSTARTRTTVRESHLELSVRQYWKRRQSGQVWGRASGRYGGQQELQPVEETGLHPGSLVIPLAHVFLHPRRFLLHRRLWRQMLSQDQDRLGLEVAKLVQLLTERWGQAPTWSEVGEAMGWSFWQHRTAVRSLARSGWLVTGLKPRSLRPGPRAMPLLAQ